MTEGYDSTDDFTANTSNYMVGRYNFGDIAMNNIKRAEIKIEAATNGTNGRETNSNLLLEAIALLLLELVRGKSNE